MLSGVRWHRQAEGGCTYIATSYCAAGRNRKPESLTPRKQRAHICQIPNLTTILILTSPLPHALHHSSIPHLHFPPYTKVEILSIACLKPLPLHPSAREGSAAETSPPPCTYSDEDCEWLWSKFVATIWDSLGQNAARDVVSFRTVCERLWRPFVQPVLDGHYGAREFSKLMIRNKALLQGESALLESIVPIPITTSTIKTAQRKLPCAIPLPGIAILTCAPKATAHTLPYYAAHLLCAAYLASHTPPKNDITLFSKTSLSKRKKRGGGTALTNRRVSKHRKISRRLLGPQAFVLERMFAIFHAVLPHEYKGGGADVMCQFATLAGLRLIVKAGVGAAAGDVLEGGTKWRVNVEWEFVRGVARGVGFDVDSYVVE